MAAQKTIAVIIVAAGTGERMGGGPKQYRMLAGTPVLARTIEAFTRPRRRHLGAAGDQPGAR